MFLYSHWLSLPLLRRIEIANIFGIEKKGSTEVFNDTIKSDGYYIKDVEEKITVESLQKYLETTEPNFVVLWSLLLDRLDGKDIEIIDLVELAQPEIKEEVKKDVKTKKTSKK